MGSKLRQIAVLLACGLVAAAAGYQFGRSAGTVRFARPFQAVLLSNGQVYYGTLEGYGTTHPVLHDVYYVQSGVDSQTRQQRTVLLRRGNEWHQPDQMYLNPAQILLVEDVGPESQVASLIRELRYQQDGGARK